MSTLDLILIVGNALMFIAFLWLFCVLCISLSRLRLARLQRDKLVELINFTRDEMQKTEAEFPASVLEPLVEFANGGASIDL